MCEPIHSAGRMNCRVFHLADGPIKGTEERLANRCKPCSPQSEVRYLGSTVAAFQWAKASWLLAAATESGETRDYHIVALSIKR